MIGIYDNDRIFMNLRQALIECMTTPELKQFMNCGDMPNRLCAIALRLEKMKKEMDAEAANAAQDA